METDSNRKRARSNGNKGSKQIPAQEFTEKQKETLKRIAIQHIIPHFASNKELAQGPKIFTKGEGCYVYDIDGNKYFDSFATLLTTICGHNRPEVNQVVKQQMELLEFFPNYVDAFTVPLIHLAEKLAEIMPGDLSVSFFVNSGSEANETALKMARQYHVERGERQRFKFIARRDSYHATTLGAAAVTGLTWFREYFEPLMPGCVFVSAVRDRETPAGMTSKAYGDHLLEEIEKLIVDEGPELIAGMIMDPLPGSNTAYPVPPEGYLKGVRDLCDKYGILLIFDEVQNRIRQDRQMVLLRTCRSHTGHSDDWQRFFGRIYPAGRNRHVAKDRRPVSPGAGHGISQWQHIRWSYGRLRRRPGQHRNHRK